MKLIRIFSLVAVVLVVAPLVSAADFGIRAGRYSDGDQDFVGAELLFDVGMLNINPNLEYLLDTDDVTAGSANLDVTFDVVNIGTFTPYVGAGVGLTYVDTDFGDSTDLVGNLIGGVTLNLTTLKPYAQVKYARLLDEDEDGGDNDDIAFIIGLRF